MSSARIVKTSQQIHQRGFSRPGRPGDTDAGTRLDVEGDVLQNSRSIVIVRKRDPAESHRARRTRQRAGMGAFEHIRRLVQHRESPFRGNEVGLHRGHFLPDRAHRSVELSQIPHHQQQVAQRQFSRFDVVHADIQHAGHAHGGQQRQHEAIAALEQRLMKTRTHSFVGPLDETLLFAFLLSKRPHDAN